jgi:flavin reductase (DIM6/NTAB) family NADH-FMN oxidoreductase RutF
MGDPKPAFVPALGRLSSGLYIVTTGVGDQATGMLGSWVQQAGFEPPAVTVAMHKERGVTEAFRACGHFCISVLSPSSMHHCKHFGRGFDPDDKPFEGLDTTLAASGVPYLTDAHAYLACKIIGESTWSDHVIFCGEVVDGSCPDLEELPTTHVRKNGLSY